MRRKRGSKLKPTKALASLGARADFDTDTGALNLRTDAHSMRRILTEHSHLEDAFNKRANAERARQSLTCSERDEFCGGTFEGLKSAIIDRDVDISGVEAQRHKLEPLTRELQTTSFATNRRRRIFSEHDGDWDLDRKFDHSPFAATAKRPSHAKTLRIDAEVAAHAGVGADEIDEYSSFLVCLIEQIESTGVSCEVNLILPNSNFVKGAHADANISVQVKKPGEYLTTQDLKAFFSTNFFRRLGFWLISFSADLLDRDVGFGLGSPNPSPEPISGSLGVLRISPKGTSPETADVVKAVNAALG